MTSRISVITAQWCYFIINGSTSPIMPFRIAFNLIEWKAKFRLNSLFVWSSTEINRMECASNAVYSTAATMMYSNVCFQRTPCITIATFWFWIHMGIWLDSKFPFRICDSRQSKLKLKARTAYYCKWLSRLTNVHRRFNCTQIKLITWPKTEIKPFTFFHFDFDVSRAWRTDTCKREIFYSYLVKSRYWCGMVVVVLCALSVWRR